MINNRIQNQKRLRSFLLIFLASLILMFACTCSIAFCFGKKDDSGEPLKKIYRRGKTTIEVRILSSKSGLATRRFNHPYHFKKTILVDLLSSIYYKNKDITKALMKKYNKPKRVFQNDEIERLTPLIIEAFSKAAPEQDLLVTSYSLRFLREGLINFFSLFMTGDKLNIVFSKIRRKGSTSRSSVLKTRNLERNIEPTRVKKSHYWELLTKPGQQFAVDHKNWLIIDFKSELFATGVEKRTNEITAKFNRKFKPIVDPLEDRIKKLEEMLAKGSVGRESVDQDPGDQTPVTDPGSSLSYFDTENTYESDEIDTGNIDFLFDNKEDINIVREKFYALRELLDERLITRINYEEKKHELLIDIQEYDVKAGLKELKELKEMGFITNSDFEETKTELLKKL
ncbi:MAG: hypothetical protein ACUZ8O_00970 [Candidatus Anammoxibacter sp.]